MVARDKKEGERNSGLTKARLQNIYLLENVMGISNKMQHK